MSDYLSIRIVDVLTDTLRTEDWSLERPVPPGRIRVPEFVELDGDRLIYSWWGDRDTVEPRWVQPARGMLEEFIRLADGPDTRIFAFAKKWGPLHICEAHGLPMSHRVRSSDGSCLAPEVEGRPNWDWEPLEAWRRYAGVALGCLHVAARLRDGKGGDDEDWERIIGIFEPYPTDDDSEAAGGASDSGSKRRDPDPEHDGEKVMLPNIAQYWLTELAHVNFYFRWDWEIGVPSLKLVGKRSELFGALGLQLVFAMSGAGGFVTCSGCGEPYTPKRQPIEGRRHYCQECGRAAAIRDAQTRFRSQHPDYYGARKRASQKPGGTAA